MKFNQLPHALLMIRSASFGYNQETAASNKFQKTGVDNPNEVMQKALVEFDHMVEQLRALDVEIFVFNDTTEVIKPDAIFPNNWISFHEDGTIILIPLQAVNRRAERRMDIIETVRKYFFCR